MLLRCFFFLHTRYTIALVHDNASGRQQEECGVLQGAGNRVIKKKRLVIPRDRKFFRLCVKSTTGPWIDWAWIGGERRDGSCWWSGKQKIITGGRRGRRQSSRGAGRKTGKNTRVVVVLGQSTRTAAATTVQETFGLPVLYRHRHHNHCCFCFYYY